VPYKSIRGRPADVCENVVDVVHSTRDLKLNVWFKATGDHIVPKGTKLVGKPVLIEDNYPHVVLTPGLRHQKDDESARTRYLDISF
jgi:hypothetical protein